MIFVRILKKLIGNFRARILTVFSILLFLAFALMGLVFNLAMNQYVVSSAHDALEEARAIHEMTENWRPGVFTRFLRTGNYRRNVRRFEMDENYTVLGIITLGSERAISENLAKGSTTHEHKRIRIDNQIFYVSILPEAGGHYSVFYLDVTDILHFSSVVNRLLVVLVAIIWLISLAITTFLADSLAKPLRILSRFARRIGNGDFTPNSHVFTNEEFEELNQSLNHTAKQLHGYDIDQKTFFQNVSHELRTPLMSIKSYAEGINYEIMSPVDASKIIIEATDKLSGMVDDILYVSRIDSISTPAMEKANLYHIIAERIKSQQSVAETKNIKIDYISDGIPIIISCVIKNIERAVDNLISNATRYAKTTITIECFAIGSRAIIRITDDGPGFEPEALPHVFERFYRGRNGLTGIGLAIVRSITEQHKGTATAENGEKSGAILTISLPRK